MRTVALIALLAASPGPGGDPTLDERFVSDLALEVGQVRIVTPGPVSRVLCDQGGLVEVVTRQDGNGFRGLAPGATTCSLTTADGVRRTVRVVVKLPDPAKRSP